MSLLHRARETRPPPPRSVSAKRESMIRKSMRLGHDAMGGYRFSLAANAKRLRGDYAQTKGWSGVTIRRKVI